MDLSFKVLDTPTMIALSASWLAKGGLGAVPEAAGLVPRVRQVQDELIAGRPSAPLETSAELAAIIAAEQKADAQHDASFRAFMHLVAANRYWAMAQDPPDESLAEAIGALLGLLAPAGAATTQQTYVAEAGSAAQAEARLAGDGDTRTLLGSMRVVGRVTGADVFAQYVASGKALGALETEKQRIEARAGAIAAPATLGKARNSWIRVASAVAAVLEQAEGDTAARLFAALGDASEKASKRSARTRKLPAVPPPGSTPPPPPPPADPGA